jgi:hypothetical protein
MHRNGYLGSKAASGAYQAMIALMPPLTPTWSDSPVRRLGHVLLRKSPAAQSTRHSTARSSVAGLAATSCFLTIDPGGKLRP